jgi:hypothetical protein
MRVLSFLVLCAGALALAGCLGERPQRVPAPPDPACHPSGHFTFLDTDTTVYRQGSRIRVTPRVNAAPFGNPELPVRCLEGWEATGPATLSRDRTILSIAPDAPPGSIVALSARHRGETIGTRLRVVGRDEIVLTGRRSQQAIEGCPAGELIGDFEFGPENRFSVTFMPFETYRDYWGSYAFDPATGRLTMSVEGGNFVPTGLDLEGRAELVDGRLVLRDMYFGSRRDAWAPSPPGGCTYRF